MPHKNEKKKEARKTPSRNTPAGQKAAKKTTVAGGRGRNNPKPKSKTKKA